MCTVYASVYLSHSTRIHRVGGYSLAYARVARLRPSATEVVYRVKVGTECCGHAATMQSFTSK